MHSKGRLRVPVCRKVIGGLKASNMYTFFQSAISAVEKRSEQKSSARYELRNTFPVSSETRVAGWEIRKETKLIDVATVFPNFERKGRQTLLL